MWAAPVVAALLAVAQASDVHVDIEHYQVSLVPNLVSGSVQGRAVLQMRALDAGDTFSLDAGELQLDAVRWHGAVLEARTEAHRSVIRLPRSLRAGEQVRLEIDYHGAPKYGLEFHPQQQQVYTIFSTSQWMPANDAPDDRATLDLKVTLPHGLQAIGSGDASMHRLGDGRVEHRWRLRTPMPSYLYGFAAGPFNVTSLHLDGIDLRLLDASLTAAQRQRWLEDTAVMLAFFADKAGVRYPHRSFSQALVVKTAGQEAATMALLSEAHALTVVAGEDDTGLMAHEIAHNWWGNGVTNRAWTEFWLNEGLATFMSAAWLQHRDGDAAYAEQVERWRVRVEKLRADGKDKPLVFPDWNKPSRDDRAVVYQKGAYALHVLRQVLGEEAFWRGIRDYTRANMGKSVTTADFKRAMEQASGRDLSVFFAKWAGMAPAPTQASSPPPRKN